MHRRLIYIIIAVVFQLSPAKGQITFPRDTSLCETGDWKLTWQDEFNGTAIDKSKWYTWFPAWNEGAHAIDTFASMLLCRRGSGVIFTDSNVAVSDGTCKLYARYQPSTWVAIGDSARIDTFKRDHTGSVIHTYNANFKKGKFEIRCKLPEAKKDVHVTFWTWGNGNHNEIDFFEWYGEKRKTTNVVHYWAPTGQHGDPDTYRYNATEWHTYSTEWDENFIRFYVDGKLKHTFYKYRGKYKRHCIPRPGRSFLLNPAAQDGNESCELIVSIDADRDLKIPPGELRVMEIDYIRVYQRINNK